MQLTAKLISETKLDAVILLTPICDSPPIIEALKYAITGALPPGNKSGQAFVHDPRTIGQHQVKASVKLRFTTKVRCSYQR